MGQAMRSLQLLQESPPVQFLLGEEEGEEDRRGLVGQESSGGSPASYGSVSGLPGGGGGGGVSLLWGGDGREEEEPLSPFPDLSHLPPELALEVLSKLNATDLCLAECVWQQLASDEILWQGLCKDQWPGASVYSLRRSHEPRLRGVSYKRIYMRLDEGTLTFNSDPARGMAYFFENGLLVDKPELVASFLLSTRSLSRGQIRRYVQQRQDVMNCMVAMQDFQGQFLPNALRKCFSKMEAPNDRGAYLQRLLAAFSERFCQCNPGLGFTVDSVYVLCFSLILLSVDLTSPHVKNKMSKREFIRNTRNAVVIQRRPGDHNTDSSDLFGEMYDNVFLRGHVSGEGAAQHRQFVPGYLALFL